MFLEYVPLSNINLFLKKLAQDYYFIQWPFFFLFFVLLFFNDNILSIYCCEQNPFTIHVSDFLVFVKFSVTSAVVLIVLLLKIAGTVLNRAIYVYCLRCLIGFVILFVHFATNNENPEAQRFVVANGIENALGVHDKPLSIYTKIQLYIYLKSLARYFF